MSDGCGFELGFLMPLTRLDTEAKDDECAQNCASTSMKGYEKPHLLPEQWAASLHGHSRNIIGGQLHSWANMHWCVPQRLDSL